MTKTSNYQLNQWAATDQVRRTDFNADNQKIDAALAGLESRAKIAAGTYTGTGSYGQGNPKILTFPFPPKFVLVIEADYTMSYVLKVLRGMTKAQVHAGLNSSENEFVTVSWSGDSVSWWNNNSAFAMLNASGRTYYYIALG